MPPFHSTLYRKHDAATLSYLAQAPRRLTDVVDLEAKGEEPRVEVKLLAIRRGSRQLNKESSFRLSPEEHRDIIAWKFREDGRRNRVLRDLPSGGDELASSVRAVVRGAVVV